MPQPRFTQVSLSDTPVTRRPSLTAFSRTVQMAFLCDADYGCFNALTGHLYSWPYFIHCMLLLFALALMLSRGNI